MDRHRNLPAKKNIVSSVAKTKATVFLLRDLFEYFNRRELSCLSTTCHRFRNVIDIDLRTTPHLVLKNHELWFKNDEWTVRSYGNGFFETASPPPKAPYLRFKYTIIFINSMTPNSLMEVLKNISHVWHNNRLTIAWEANFTPTAEFAQLVRTSQNLILRGNGALSMMDYLNEAACEEMSIEDYVEIPPVTLPVNSIIEFLSKSMDNERYQELAIRTRETPSRYEFEQLIEAIKQKFVASTTRWHFRLEIGMRHGEIEPNDFQIINNADNHYDLYILDMGSRCCMGSYPSYSLSDDE
ncbi:hypothetical protein DdX_12364 [Ditylenchus destructor]|uniref:F-box domain-containing protein n=1 Tax=Ditylenchus destructor TaxID=166010 RepID=A0AAD4R3Q0_9BILA|nr:hypothetical protein DdX_12364 [Ditylenchus destructor]